LLGIATVERDIDRTELYICDEAFLCGSAMEIGHITDVDGYTVGNGAVGSITRRLSEAYHQAITGRLEQYRDWLTPVYDL
jgi:branched-chain amino acid aminotransferase